jgi:hypothetical protein
VILDGTLIPIDRVARDKPFYSGKHKKHGMNLQVIASPDGEGLYKLGRLPTFFEDPDRCGYLIYSSQAHAGFALIRGLAQGYFKIAVRSLLITLGSHASGSSVCVIGHRRWPAWTRTLCMQVYQ